MHHHYEHSRAGKALKWSFAVTLAFVALEFWAGIRAESLALVSDAGHNFTDALSLILAVIAIYIQSKPPDETKTYGYQRAGVLAAFVNALTLVVLALWIFYEAAVRLTAPPAVQTGIMLVVAIIALAVNGGVMLSLHRDKHDLNVRAAFVHMLGDALSSIGIIAGALVIHATGWFWIDPALSIAIGALIIWTAWDIIKECLNVLLEGLPRGITLSSVVSAMQEIDGVIDVHDLHIWTLGTQAHALSCHVLIDDMPPSASESILRRINEVLCEFHIRHTTVQFEHARCELSDASCTVHWGRPHETGERHQH